MVSTLKRCQHGGTYVLAAALDPSEDGFAGLAEEYRQTAADLLAEAAAMFRETDHDDHHPPDR